MVFYKHRQMIAKTKTENGRLQMEIQVLREEMEKDKKEKEQVQLKVKHEHYGKVAATRQMQDLQKKVDTLDAKLKISQRESQLSMQMVHDLKTTATNTNTGTGTMCSSLTTTPDIVRNTPNLQMRNQGGSSSSSSH